MKLTLMFLLVGVLQLSASVHAQNGKLNVQVENMQLSELLWQLQEESSVVFIYQTDDVKDVKDISVDMSAASITDILNEVLKGTDLDYVVDEEVVVIKKKEIVPVPAVEEKQQEKRTIKGKVTDKDGFPLPGVSVVIKGTSTGVATDIDGNYSLELESDKEVLIFSFVGMLPQEVLYNGQSIQNITLTSDTEQMAEVVVTGYQTISKERATGAFEKVGVKELDEKISTSIMGKLEGQATGVLYNSDGSFTIRGKSTFYANVSPLIVVDGFPIEGDLETINPNDVESMTVLKDAAAASIWGARAANGVIVIVSKKASKNKSVNIDFSVDHTIRKLADLNELTYASTGSLLELEKHLSDYEWMNLPNNNNRWPLTQGIEAI
ncbi:carboxypeptidase-like regulatory domain-containing protein [Marinifilum fragile]|uniref:carboxypeptidase-like regulatory domain-containing protein n=1 Tax=Marinifilum fragile TaxID=570161 RepID=UPI000AEC7C68|nr:carboxypeptidase-like regulatory domain-containing protein [Marinifilum fragile]